VRILTCSVTVFTGSLSHPRDTRLEVRRSLCQRRASVRETLKETRQEDFGLQPGQRCANTEVDAVEEGEVRVVRAVDVEAIGVLESGVVTVGRTTSVMTMVPVRDRFTEAQWLWWYSGRSCVAVDRAQHLLDGAGPRSGVLTPTVGGLGVVPSTVELRSTGRLDVVSLPHEQQAQLASRVGRRVVAVVGAGPDSRLTRSSGRMPTAFRHDFGEIVEQLEAMTDAMVTVHLAPGVEGGGHGE